LSVAELGKAGCFGAVIDRILSRFGIHIHAFNIWNTAPLRHGNWPAFSGHASAHLGRNAVGLASWNFHRHGARDLHKLEGRRKLPIICFRAFTMRGLPFGGGATT
jgi:hypothetical protein